MQDMDRDISADSLKSDGTLHSDVFTEQKLKIKHRNLLEVCQVLLFFFFLSLLLDHCSFNQLHCFLQCDERHKKRAAGRTTLGEAGNSGKR